jgi:hypothetical protein
MEYPVAAPTDVGAGLSINPILAAGVVDQEK